MPNKNKKPREKDDLQGEGQLSDPLTWKKSFDTLLHDKGKSFVIFVFFSFSFIPSSAISVNVTRNFSPICCAF